MTKSLTNGAFLLTAAMFGWPTSIDAQHAGFDDAVEIARMAWLDHDISLLMAHSDTVRLHLPGVGRTPAVRPSQAARVLRQYLKEANEIAFELRSVRVVTDDHAYAEMVRRYVVQGTSDERTETVFFGFRLTSGRWGIREVRITP